MTSRCESVRQVPDLTTAATFSSAASNAQVFSHWLDNDARVNESSVGQSADFLRIVNSGYSYIKEHSNFSDASCCGSLDVSVLNHSSLSETRTEVVRRELTGVYSLDAAGRNRLAAQKLMHFIEDHLHSTSLDIANKILTEADFSRLSSRTLIGLVRSTARAQKVLPAWWTTYRASRLAVKKLGKDPDSLFVGLPQLTES